MDEKYEGDMFGKGWMYRGWRGNVIHKLQDAMKKVAGGRNEVPKRRWKTKKGEWMANFGVTRFFLEDLKEWRRKARLPCLCLVRAEVVGV